MSFLRILSLAFIAVLASAGTAFAAEPAASGVGELSAIAAGFAIGIAALGGTLGQGKLVSAALDAIARNPGASGQLQTPILLGLAFVESLVIFALLIAFKLAGFF